ncbi:MAG: hypothetical protein ACYC99_17205, partial [Candidatus Geothermincolia bacterium]
MMLKKSSSAGARHISCRLAVLAALFLSLSLFLTLLSCPGTSAVPAAGITVSGSEPVPGTLSPALYGGFIEFVPEMINGRNGIWAQELYNRGFDEDDGDGDGVSGLADAPGCAWQPLADQGVGATWSLTAGGFNPNGRYEQVVTRSAGTGDAGLWQYVVKSRQQVMDLYV